MPNILQDFMVNLGRQVEYQKAEEQRLSEQQARQALAQLRTQEVQDAQARAAETRRLQGVRQQLSSKIAEAQQADVANVQSLQGSAQALARYAMQLDAEGDFEGGKRLMEDSRNMQQQAKTLQETQLKGAAEKQEKLSGAAWDAQQAPTPENLKALAQAAVDAGVNPLDIPRPGTPEMKVWIDKQVNAGRTVKEKMDAADKERDRKERLQERREEARQRALDRERDRRQNAANQEANRSLQRELALLREGGRNARGQAGAKQTATERGQILQLSEGLGQFSRHWENLAESSASTTLGPFSQLKPGGNITSALAQLGGLKVTQQEAQLEMADVRGMAKAYTSAVQAVMKGRAPTETQLKQIEANLAAQAGETKLTALYKKVLMAEDAKTLAERSLPFFPEEQTADIKKDIETLHTPITSKQIREYVRKTQGAAAAESLVKSGESIRSAMESAKGFMAATGEQPAKPAPAAPAAPKPSVDLSKIPDDLKKYFH